MPRPRSLQLIDQNIVAHGLSRKRDDHAISFILKRWTSHMHTTLATHLGNISGGMVVMVEDVGYGTHDARIGRDRFFLGHP